MATEKQTQYIKDIISGQVNRVRNHQHQWHYNEVYGKQIYRQSVDENIRETLSNTECVYRIEAEAVIWADTIQVPEDVNEASALIDNLNKSGIVVMFLRSQSDFSGYLTSIAQ